MCRVRPSTRSKPGATIRASPSRFGSQSSSTRRSRRASRSGASRRSVRKGRDRLNELPSMQNLFVKGLIVGFCLAAPVGPIAALCVQRTIAKSWLSGMVSGLGAAVADALYGAIAAFGATIISEFLITERSWLQRIGGVILILMGLRLLLMKTKPRESINGNGSRGLMGDFLPTLMLTLTNPMTFVAFAA